ncbi:MULTISPECIES: hypothetical protein [unclassified Streptomyces]
MGRSLGRPAAEARFHLDSARACLDGGALETAAADILTLLPYLIDRSV